VESYLTQQLSIIEQAVKSPDGIAGFIGESLLGCGGQILLPPGYLKGTYEQIRKFGGICIADEVQVGFGRIGSHFWGFQVHGVVPDIITMGKPMGNGHPLGAVVTTKEIALSFDNGMEYFNSFGGNPVSCEIGKSVLSLIESERLQENARVVGNYLKLGLKDLKNSHSIIGDVRGLGLFLGIEIVENQHSRKPNAMMASQIKEAMKDRGILLSTDGPMNNVIKIKPPLVFTKNNADRVVDQLGQVIKKLASK
jgi:4-aminobutyrate aminotransferase-like enzyme